MDFPQGDHDAPVRMLGEGVWRIAVARLPLRRWQAHPGLAALPGQVGAIDVYQPFEGCFIDVGGDGLADLVKQRERRLVGHAEQPTQGSRAQSFHIGCEDDEGFEDLLQRQLVVGERGVARDRKDPRAAMLSAAPLLARSDPVVLVLAAAARTDLGAAFAPTDLSEKVVHTLCRQSVDVFEGEVPRSGGQKKVASHGWSPPSLALW